MLSIKCRKCREPLAFEAWERGELIDLMVIIPHSCGEPTEETKEPYKIIICPFCASEHTKLTLKHPNGDLGFTCQACYFDWIVEK